MLFRSARINARLKPALELDDRGVITFDSPDLTPDSSYFTGAPTAVIGGRTTPHGLIRASVCPEGQLVCKVVTIGLSVRD